MEELLHEDEIPVGRAKDLRGQVFNNLTVLYRTANQGKKVIWKCRCTCGKEVSIAAGNLTNGHTKSCGCLKYGNFDDDLTGLKFGKLTCLEKIKVLEQKHSMWKCRCECGGETIVSRGNLISNHTKSCGCLQEETRCAPKEWLRKDLTNIRFNRTIAVRPYEVHKKKGVLWECKCDCGTTHYAYAHKLLEGAIQSCGCLKYNNIAGQRFGKLVAITPTDERQTNGGSVMWKCQCDCGNIKLASVHDLIGGGVSSCGCIVSVGEFKIKQILTKAHVAYSEQKTFDSCRNPLTNKLLRFDFYIENKFLIEYDGKQHFEANGGWSTEEKLADTIQRDQYKNQWCKENNIPLIRIPYTKLDTLCIEDLLPETTQFRVV